jgi:hypothetical protein
MQNNRGSSGFASNVMKLASDKARINNHSRTNPCANYGLRLPVLFVAPVEQCIGRDVLNRLLEKPPADARQGGNGRKSAVYRAIQEHFEPISNAAWGGPKVFQQPVNS